MNYTLSAAMVGAVTNVIPAGYRPVQCHQLKAGDVVLYSGADRLVKATRREKFCIFMTLDGISGEVRGDSFYDMPVKV